MSRGTRSALQEISRTSPRMETRSDHDNIALMDSLLTPSPDEQVIKQRGRMDLSRTAMDNWLATGEMLGLMQTPIKPRTPTKSASAKIPTTPSRSSPRKRLLLSDPLVSPVKPTVKTKVQSQLVKRQRFQRQVTSSADLETSLKGLTQTQLVDVLLGVIHSHPDLKQELSNVLPQPDLQPAEERLNYLSSNIFKAFPYNRYGTNRDAFSYKRVSVHLAAFKKECLEQGKLLVNSNQWSSIIDYVLLAWTVVQELPNWESPAHNKPKEQCFSSLATQCMKGLKKLTYDREHFEDLLERLKEAEAVCNEIGPCTKFVARTIEKFEE